MRFLSWKGVKCARNALYGRNILGSFPLLINFLLLQDVNPVSSRRRRPSLSRSVFRYPTNTGGGQNHYQQQHSHHYHQQQNQPNYVPSLSKIKNSSTLSSGFDDTSQSVSAAYEDDAPIGAMRGLSGHGPIAMSALFNHHHNMDKPASHMLSSSVASSRALSSYSAITIDSIPHYWFNWRMS